MREGGVEGDKASVRRCWGRWQREAGGTRMQGAERRRGEGGIEDSREGLEREKCRERLVGRVGREKERNGLGQRWESW